MRNARMGPSESRDAWVAEWREEIEDHGGMRGSWDANVHDKELDGDGVACEVIFPDADAAGASRRHRPNCATCRRNILKLLHLPE